MSTKRIMFAAATVMVFWMADTSETQAQYQRGANLSRGISSVQGYGRAGGLRGGFGARGGIRGRGVRGGVDTLFYGNTGHEFARTIPRVFGDPILPYFSLFPPVYYSTPVARPYGFSPFALPPGVQPAEGIVGPGEPQMTVNPFFNQEQNDDADGEENEDADEPAQNQQAKRRQVVTNPFFVKELSPEQAKRLAGKTPAKSLDVTDLR